MINLKKYLLPLLVMGTLAFNTASAELTVVTVSMQKLFDGYYKSADANERLESIREQAVSEAQEKEQELQAMAEEISLMQEDLQNPVLSDESMAEKQANSCNSILEPGESCGVTVRFSSDTAGSYQGRVFVSSSDPED
ncbi:MAG: hypothetical protein R6V45_09225 [Oceanipulchritudo sp.]